MSAFFLIFTAIPVAAGLVLDGDDADHEAVDARVH